MQAYYFLQWGGRYEREPLIHFTSHRTYIDNTSTSCWVCASEIFTSSGDRHQAIAGHSDISVSARAEDGLR